MSVQTEDVQDGSGAGPNSSYPAEVIVLDHSLVRHVLDGPRLLRKFVVWAAIFIAGALLMLARSSPALAADSHDKHDNGKQSSATSQRNDAPSHQHDQEVGGGGGNRDGDGK